MRNKVLSILASGVAALLLIAGCVSQQANEVSQERHVSVQAASKAQASLQDQTFLFADAPAPVHYPNSWTVLVNHGYESAYDEVFKNPAWVAYHISGTPGSHPGPRPSGYPTDTRTTSQLEAADYPPGYDHGHMACNETIGEFFGDQGQADSFLMTNMVPQKHGLNAGPWKSVETEERTDWVKTYHDVWVIAGPVYTTEDDQPVAPKTHFGNKKLCIPVACFKIVCATDTTGKLHTIAFIMPQDGAKGHKPAAFATSIREVERRTQLNFFSTRQKSEQDEIELPTHDSL
jgi:endonuclease G